MPEIRVQDEQGNVHVFPDEATPEMISRAMGLAPPVRLPPAVASGEAQRNINSVRGGANINPEIEEALASGHTGDVLEATNALLGIGKMTGAQPGAMNTLKSFGSLFLPGPDLPHNVGGYAAAPLMAPARMMGGIEAGALESGKATLPALKSLAEFKSPAPGETGSAIGGLGGLALLGAGLGLGDVKSPVAEAVKGSRPMTAIRGLGGDIAESALNIPWRERMRGRTPGESALSETTGLRTGKLLESATGRRNQVGKAIQDTYANATLEGRKVSLKPVNSTIDAMVKVAKEQNRPDLIEFLERERARLMETGEEVNPSKLWQLKRGTGKLAGGWEKLDPTERAAIRQALYGSMRQELNRVVPEGSELNNRYANLESFADRAEIEDLKSPFVQGVIDRIGARTGSLTAAMVGGLEGGLPGFAAGLVGPELFNRFGPKMAMARALWSLGGGERLPPPIPGVAMPPENFGEPDLETPTFQRRGGIPRPNVEIPAFMRRAKAFPLALPRAPLEVEQTLPGRGYRIPMGPSGSTAKGLLPERGTVIDLKPLGYSVERPWERPIKVTRGKYPRKAESSEK